LGVEFDVVVSGVDELSGGEPEFEVVENARRKVQAVARGEGEAVAGASGGVPAGEFYVLGTPPDALTKPLVIGCDTDVVLDGKALGKPRSEVEAREYLDRMSGRSHEVLSGLVILDGEEERSGLERTSVVFKELSEAEKDRYVDFGEWRGRSGGYAIQTLGSTLVERVEGSVSNVVGLPVGLLIELAPGLFERA
jgi:septum formation protein